jgi:hypothetical protein
MCGTPEYPLIDQIRDNIAAFGLKFAVQYYYKRMPAKEARMFLIAAYC